MKKTWKKVVNLKESRHSLNILRGENTATSLDHVPLAHKVILSY